MGAWATRRKFAYTSVFIFVTLAIIASIFFLFYYKKPTCFDGKQNGTETGVDCGGKCSLVCGFEIRDPVVSWARAFSVTTGVYSMAAYIQNPNLTAQAEDVPYTFQLLDEKNILIYERKGKTRIPPNSTFVIFEPNAQVGGREVKHTFFEFGEKPVWKKTSNSTREEDFLVVKNQKLTTTSLPIKFEASLENRSFEEINKINVAVVLYDAAGNALASSQTVVDSIKPESEQSIVFTWPQAFLSEVARFEVLPLIK